MFALTSLIASSFQSTPPRREVTHGWRDHDHGHRISIHTSPKGGDSRATLDDVNILISIHTSPKGGDMTAMIARLPSGVFQSTPPRREVTRISSPTTTRSKYFNPHLPEGK